MHVPVVDATEILSTKHVGQPIGSAASGVNAV